MADEESEVDVKKKSPLIKIVVIALVAIIVLAGTVVGTLFLSGFFEKKAEHHAEEQLAGMAEKAAGEGHGNEGHGGEGKGGEGQKGGEGHGGKGEAKKQSKETPEFKRFESRYYSMERELVSNLTASKKVMQVQVAIMTHYDERVIEHMKKHDVALRAATLDVLRQTTEAELADPNFRKNLAEKVRAAMNGMLERYEDFGGIEEVFFPSFVVQ